MYLGIDLGTTDLKLLLLSEANEVVATRRAPLRIEREDPLWSEQDPLLWWETLDRLLLEWRHAHPRILAQVRAIGLAGQMHGAVLLGANDEVLRPAILWNDGRSAAQCDALQATVPDLSSITGNRAMPGFTAPKLLWVRQHEPDIFRRTTRILLPKDFLRLRLTGEAITECSDASGTLWLDVANRRWSGRVLAACGLTLEHMPRLVEGSETAGRLRSELAGRWGLTPEIPVAGGGGDNAASAVGVGAIDPGQGFVSLGTSGVIFRVSDGYQPRPASGVHTFCHALPDRWHQMSVMLSAASCLTWAARLTGLNDEAALLAQAEQLPRALRERAPIFLPYLSGERTPHNDPRAMGVLFGLTHEHGAGALAFSVMEGVGFGMLDGYRVLSPTEGADEALALVGGGAKSPLWGQLLASMLGVPLVVSPGNQAGAALGAARLAWLAAGGTLAEVTQPGLSPVTRFDPDPDAYGAIAERYARFRALYPALSPYFSKRGSAS